MDKKKRKERIFYTIPYGYVFLLGAFLMTLLVVTFITFKDNAANDENTKKVSNEEQIKNKLIDSNEVYKDEEVPAMTEYAKEDISVNYPETWTIDGDALSDNDVVVQYNSPEDDLVVNISKVELDNIRTLDDYINTVTTTYPKDDPSCVIISADKTTVAGLDAAKVIFTYKKNDIEMRMIQIFTSIDNIAYLVTINVLDSNYEEKKVEISAFINSLKISDLEEGKTDN